MSGAPPYRIFETSQFDKDLRNIARAGHADVVDKLPVLFRTMRATRISPDRLDELVEKIRGS